MRVKKEWSDEAEALYNQGLPWVEIAQIIQVKYLPEESPYSVGERVRSYIRCQPFYKGKQQRTNEKSPPLSERPNTSFDEGKVYKEDGSIISTKFIMLAEGQNLSPRELLQLHGLNPADWQVYTYKNNYWNSQKTGGSLQISYQSTLIAKPLTGVRPDMNELRKVFDELVREPLPPLLETEIIGENLAVVHIADLHLGKLCWYGESPDNYDYKIARDTFFRAIFDVKVNLENKGIEKILFVWSNDFFNSDNPEQTTTKGTRQDTDVREKKLYAIGCKMLAQGINLLKEIAPISTFYTPSNHDEVSAFHALLFLEAFFRNDPRVTVDTDPYPRKFLLYGITLLGFCHGNTEGSRGSSVKASLLASTMPIEARELWSQAKVYEMHTAHLHSEQQIQEINGVIVRRISSPTAADNYHTRAGYIGAVRKCQTFVYNKEQGLIHIINSPV